MRKIAVLVAGVMVCSFLAGVGGRASAQVLCDPDDHCYSKKKEHLLIDHGKWAAVKPAVSGSGTVTKAGPGCWHLPAPVILREFWVWHPVDAITFTATAHWCWDENGKITSHSVLASSVPYTYSFWSEDSTTKEADNVNYDRTRVYVRWATNWSECVTYLVPVCVHAHMFVAVTMRSYGDWDVSRGVMV